MHVSSSHETFHAEALARVISLVGGVGGPTEAFWEAIGAHWKPLGLYPDFFLKHIDSTHFGLFGASGYWGSE